MYDTCHRVVTHMSQLYITQSHNTEKVVESSETDDII